MPAFAVRSVTAWHVVGALGRRGFASDTISLEGRAVHLEGG